NTIVATIAYVDIVVIRFE
ncbi:putative membrane protein, partial [Vibrio parahaemolyticus EKP-008]